MGGTSAYLDGSAVTSKEASGPSDLRPSRAERLKSAGANLYLQAAAALHVVALIVSLSTSGATHNAALIAASLVLIALALWLSKDAAAEPRVSSAAATAPNGALASAPERSTQAVAPVPPPLPFMGERILLNTDHSSLARLSKATARLSQVTAARSHPWGELMARVSHELRTPLHAVIGFSDVMDAELLGPVGHPRYREYARHIRDCGRELLKSAEDTLAITCLLEGDRDLSTGQNVDLAAIMSEAWRFYGSHVDARGISLHESVPEGLELIVERRALRQILINLFAEALRRVNDGGVIGFTAYAHGDLVQLEVLVRGRPDTESVGQASLPVCLARALLELHGAALVEVDDPFATWRALTVLKCAAQPDFFALSHATPGQPTMHVN